MWKISLVKKKKERLAVQILLHSSLCHCILGQGTLPTWTYKCVWLLGGSWRGTPRRAPKSSTYSHFRSTNSNSSRMSGLTVWEEGVGEVQRPHQAGEGVVRGAGLDLPLHRRQLHFCQLRLQTSVGLLQLAGRVTGWRWRWLERCGEGKEAPGLTGTFAALLTWCFLSETRLRRILLKDWRRDFLMLFTLDRGPSMASWSLGFSVHLEIEDTQSWYCWSARRLSFGGRQKDGTQAQVK